MSRPFTIRYSLRLSWIDFCVCAFMILYIMSHMVSAVLDTNVIVSALRSKRGASYALLKKVFSNEIQISLSVPLYFEYQEVTLRSELKLDEENREKVIRYLALIAREVKVHYLWRPFLVDPKDDMVLELGVASNSDIVTHNMKDFLNVDDKFDISVKTPGQLLEELS